ncbi:MAG: hypothetical protein II114_03655 [Treponema sp.]|nr:hypothetical protein [Treponema sp.]MBQ4235562.1 hypothetical protein [Treponema sp.]MBQ5382826.1 hypothetical protein [Treponema sp.]
MADETPKGSTRAFEPGTFERTRKNLGPLDDTERMEMAQKIGGEILPEKSVPVDPSKMPKKRNATVIARATGHTSADTSTRSGSLSATSGVSSPKRTTVASDIMKKTDSDLPPTTSRDLKLMNKLMMDEEYQIKSDRGFLNFFYNLSSKNKERLSKDYGSFKVKKQVEHLQIFITTIKTFIQLSPDTYKANIATESDLKFKFLRTVGKWNLKTIRPLAAELEEMSEVLTVPMMIPYVKAMYHEIITVYYIGEQQIPALIKEIFADLSKFPDLDKNYLQSLAKEGITEWLYVHSQILKGLYPLLMRMCSQVYVEFPEFFTKQIAQILQFVGLSKFDLLLPEKKKKSDEEIKREEEEARKKAEEKRHVPGKKDELVNMGLKLLEQLFPDAGFSRLDSHPDMFPYFQPIYKFNDGFNMLNPENGLQVTIVLVKILDDLFHGCRNVNFNVKADEKLGLMDDNLSDVMADWGSYIDDLFYKKLGDYIRNFMNSFYSQSDYPTTNYGKENINNILWREKLYFLPNLKFSAPTLNKPRNDSKYKPLYARTDYIRTVFTVIGRRIDENSAAKKPVLGVLNPWDRYEFDIPNIVSKRLDVLLGAKKDDAHTAATNANLIKYTLCISAVLDWWINNVSSPAYTTNAMDFYRVSPEGGPEFSAELREDQNQLFVDAIKKAVAAKK